MIENSSTTKKVALFFICKEYIFNAIIMIISEGVMIRYGIISDIHGNLEALKSVVEDMKEQHIDRVICLGDIISKGAHGHECLEMVKNLADAVVRGNNDIRYTKALDEIASEPNFDYEYFYWTQKQLTNDDIKYLRAIPMCCEFMLSGRLVRCFHATADDSGKSVFNFDDYNSKLNLFNPSEYSTDKIADVVVYGHTHHIGMEKMFGRLLINAGSVGNSLNIVSDSYFNAMKTSEFTQAEYVIVSGEDGDKIGDIAVEFRVVNYDKNKELDGYDMRGYKFEQYRNEIIFGEYRNPERISIQNMAPKV